MNDALKYIEGRISSVLAQANAGHALEEVTNERLATLIASRELLIRSDFMERVNQCVDPRFGIKINMQ